MIDQNMSLKEDNTNYCSQQKVDAKKNHIPMVKQQMLVLTGRIGSYRLLWVYLVDYLMEDQILLQKPRNRFI